MRKKERRPGWVSLGFFISSLPIFVVGLLLLEMIDLRLNDWQLWVLLRLGIATLGLSMQISWIFYYIEYPWILGVVPALAICSLLSMHSLIDLAEGPHTLKGSIIEWKRFADGTIHSVRFRQSDGQELWYEQSTMPWPKQCQKANAKLEAVMLPKIKEQIHLACH